MTLNSCYIQPTAVDISVQRKFSLHRTEPSYSNHSGMLSLRSVNLIGPERLDVANTATPTSISQTQIDPN